VRSTTTPDFEAQIVQTRDKVAEAVGAIADRIDTDEIKNRAESSATDLFDAATDENGRPRRGLLVGLAGLLLVGLVIRKLLG
jgi:hypothetical protein